MFINRPFYHYRYNENSISSSHDEDNHRYVLRCFEKINQFIETSKSKEALRPWFDNRLLYVIVTTAISGYFNPANREPYSEKKRKFKEYCKQPMIQAALRTNNRAGLSQQRKIVLFLVRHRLYLALDFMGKIRKWQKMSK